MNFSPVVNPALSFLSESATSVLSLSPVAMSSYEQTLLVKVGYRDNGAEHQAYLIYNTATEQYSENLSEYLGGIAAVKITSVAVAFEAAGGVTFAIAYVDLKEAAHWQLNVGNRLALVQNGTLMSRDLIEQVTGEVANEGLGKIVLNSSGTAVSFSSAVSNLTDYSDTNDADDVFRIDITGQTLQRLSQVSAEVEGSKASDVLGASESGGQEYILFETASVEFSVKDTNNKHDLYVVALNSGDVLPQLISEGSDNLAASVVSEQAILTEGSVIYVSESDLLVAGDANQSPDIFVQNFATGTRQRLTDSLDEIVGTESDVDYQLFGIDQATTKLLFASNYQSLETDVSLYQVYLMDLTNGAITLESASLTGDLGNDSSVSGVMDRDGTNYAFLTQATNIAAGPGTLMVTTNAPVNHAPIDIVLDNRSVEENSAGAHVANISATDPDKDDTLNYSIVDSADGAMFRVLSGMLHLAENVAADYQDKNKLIVELVATDAGALRYQETFEVAITETNVAADILADNAGLTTSVSTVEGKASHTDVNVSDEDNVFLPISAGQASSLGYGTYSVAEDGAWVYSLDNTNVTVRNLSAGETVTDTLTVTAEDGTAKAVTITITGAADTMIKVDANNYLDNTTLNLYHQGVDTTVSMVVDNGAARANENIAFDAVKLSDSTAYNADITISDAIGILRHIVGINTLNSNSHEFHAADIDNDNAVTISDAIDVLRDIVGIKKIDTFDLIDEQGERMTQLDTGDVTANWNIVANGDVDLTGDFSTTVAIDVL